MSITIWDAEGTRHTLPLASDQKTLEQTLAQTIWLSGVFPAPPLCSGLGRCGACRVRFLTEPPAPVETDYTVLGEQALQDGWRLACRHAAVSGSEIALPEAVRSATVQENTLDLTIPSSAQALRLAVDLGTTSLHWQMLAVDAEGQHTVAGQGHCLNPQMGAGSDVVSRIAAASSASGRARLRDLVVRRVQKIMDACPLPVLELCLAGNTAMTAIMLDAPMTRLTETPYGVPDAGGRTVLLEGLPPIWIPPQPAPFVGGDISAGMASLLQEASFPFLLADLGTNGECVLALSPTEALLTSVPLGPSLEGIGLSYGGMAETGSVAAFRLTPTGLVPTILGGGEARCLCGTGYLSLLALLLRIGFLEPSGRMAAVASMAPLARRLAQTVEATAAGWRLPVAGGFLTAADVEELLKVKAAFSLALERLLHAGGLSAHELSAFVLGGALGEHVVLDDLETLGFIPQGMQHSIRLGGNTSLAGARLLLERPELREPLVAWSAQTRLVRLTEDEDFMQEYMRHMTFA